MRLYYRSGSSALSPHIAVYELELPVEIEKVVTAKEGLLVTEPHGENYLDINPRRYVPALKLDTGEVMTEGPAIIQYLSDQAPLVGLSPKYGSLEHYHLLEWLTYISMELHKNFGPAFRKDLPENERAKALDKLKERLSWVEKALEKSDYLVADKFGLADIYCFTILRWHSRAGIGLANDFPRTHAYYERIGARPMVMKAMEEEGVKMYA